MYTPWKGHLEREQPQLEDLQTIVVKWDDPPSGGFLKDQCMYHVSHKMDFSAWDVEFNGECQDYLVILVQKYTKTHELL